MRNIIISDVTMKQKPEEGGFALSFREKIELARQLDRLGVDRIETGPIANRRTDSLLLKSIASAVKTAAVVVPLILEEADSAAVTWKALQEAVHPCLQVTAPVSTAQMEYRMHRKNGDMVELVRSRIREAAALTPEVEFVAEDAGRAEAEFLREILAAAVEAGARAVTVCDTAGTLLPDEFYASVSEVRRYVPAEIRLGVLCSGELGLAGACAMAAARAGADEVKVCVAGNFTASLEELVRILKLRGGDFNLGCGVRDTELRRGVGQLRRLVEPRGGKGGAVEAHPGSGGPESELELELSRHDDLGAVLQAAVRLGYELSEEDGAKVYESFRRIAEKKERVGARELDAIIAAAALQVPPTYQLDNYVINSGNTITATSHIRLRKGEQTLDGLAVGDGPIDASFLAMERIVGRHYELDDFRIQSVTQGREAMGEAVVRIRSGGKLYSGRGISTDVISSSIRAYLGALNKIAYEEGE